MSFEIRKETARGLFHIKLVADVPYEQMMQLCQLADNIVGTDSSKSSEFIGPKQETSLASTIRWENDHRWEGKNSFKLGANPVESIFLADYKEPPFGSRLKIVYIAKEDRPKAVLAFRAITSIPLKASMAIVDGNYPCPKLAPAKAEEILGKFEALGVYARIQEAA